LQAILARQRQAFHHEGAPTVARRRTNLLKLKDAVLARRREYEAAVNADFGHRPAHETAIMELVPTVQGIDYLRRNLARWMRPRRRRVAMHLRPGSAKVLYQPLGVVGILSPWNFPVGLSLAPLAAALAAGNRVMIKPSEFTPRTTSLIAAMLGEMFADTEVAVVSGGPETGAAFSALPFDHVIFTGSTQVGRNVMRAAGDNLVPVTLELGGKSPAIIGRGYSLPRAARSIIFGKLANAGQTCIAPDYALVQKSEIPAFIEALKLACRIAYPMGVSDEAYSAIISQHHYERLNGMIADAKARGAGIVEISANAPRRERSLVPTIILGATSEMTVMQEEIFGPVLPVIAYETIDDAIAYVNAHPRPLALYIFSDQRNVVEQVLAHTTSGNVTVNDTLLHYVVDDLPFGGVGPSGIGTYHSEEGFRSLSHAKGVFTQSRWNFAGLMRAPFGQITSRTLTFLLR
jgi:coniferyl-aldehyde dehydrogenase